MILHKIWKSKSGMTLVEMIVVFALMGLFMVAATFVMTSSFRQFYRIQFTTKAVTVSDLLLDKIAGELSSAKVGNSETIDNSASYAKYYVEFEDNEKSPWITMENRSGSPIAIFAEKRKSGTGMEFFTEDIDKDTYDGHLVIRYYSVNAGADGNSSARQEVNWKFDDSVYMGYKIESLTFSRPAVTSPAASDDRPNVFRIDLTITNGTFTYSTWRYAECYNFTIGIDEGTFKTAATMPLTADGAESDPGFKKPITSTN